MGLGPTIREAGGHMDRIDVMIEEYKALRDEVVRTPSQRLQILSIGIASAAVLFAASINSIAVGNAHIVPGLALLLVIPSVCWASLDTWIAEATRGRRASFYLWGIERRINRALGERVLAWEEELRKRDDPQMYMFRGHYWHVWTVFTAIAAISAAVGGYNIGTAICVGALSGSRIWQIVCASVPLALVSIGSAIIYVSKITGFGLWDVESPHWPTPISR
jgi:hypothetical protein